jgi:hypothetical protein
VEEVAKRYAVYKLAAVREMAGDQSGLSEQLRTLAVLQHYAS